MKTLEEMGYNQAQIDAHNAKKERMARQYAAAQPLPALPMIVVKKPQPVMPKVTFKDKFEETLATVDKPHKPYVAIIKEIVSEAYQVEVEVLSGKSQKRHYSLPRQVAIYLSCRLTDCSLNMIAHQFGGRDHSTIIHARNSIAMKMSEDVALRNKLEAMVWNIKARLGR